MSIGFYYILHGCPNGQQSTATKDDPAEFRAYADFHKTNSKYIDSPSKPGAKFIKETLPSGNLAWTFVRTGVYEAGSNRPGSNYAAITLFFSKDTKISNEKEFQQALKQWFEVNVLDQFTTNIGNKWRKWTKAAEYSIFRNKMDDRFGKSLIALLRPYLSTSIQTETKINQYNTAVIKLKAEIQNLENQEKDIQQKLSQKYAELKKLNM